MSGRRRSSQLVFRRRMSVLRMLLQKPMTETEIIAAVEADLGAGTYPKSDRHAWKHDLSALRTDFACEIDLVYDSQQRVSHYELRGLGSLALLQLSPDEGRMFERLRLATQGPGAPEHSALRQMFSRIELLRFYPLECNIEEAA